MLPPTRPALLPHLMRANYMAMRLKTYPMRRPNLPPIEQNGWEVQDDKLIPVRCFSLSAYLHQGLSSSSQNAVAGQTAVGADVAAIKMLCLAHPWANATVGCVRTKPEMK